MDNQCVGVLGARSLVGDYVLAQLIEHHQQIQAFSRQPLSSQHTEATWHTLNTHIQPNLQIKNWLCVAPIWILPTYFFWLEKMGIRKIIVLSSTSRFSKDHSSDSAEQAIARRLLDAEQQVEAWAARNSIECVILRPTLIYGDGRDKNIAEITRFIGRFGFFPVFGQATGLRQPIHAEDVASACVSALLATHPLKKSYNLSGGETLTYQEMVRRIFLSLKKTPCIMTIPLVIFRVALIFIRLVPRYRQWSVAMAERMNQDLVFDHQDAATDLAFQPRGFKKDLS